MAGSKFFLSCLALFAVFGLYSAQSANFAYYNRVRSNFINDEHRRGIGGRLKLNAKETRLNNHIMKLKGQDIKDGLLDPSTFAPAQHFFEVVDKINKAPLFKIIQDMPKGGILHAHSTALCNLDFFITLTYWEHLWQLTDRVTHLPQFKFSRTKPASGWVLVKEERKRIGARAYDSQLRTLLSMLSDNPTEYRDAGAMWTRLEEIFRIVGGVLQYKDAMKAYYEQSLKEFEADGVNYVELRTSLSKPYDLDNNEYTEEDVAQLYLNVTNQYKKSHPKFMGTKIIYAPGRYSDDDWFDYILSVTKKLTKKFPGFIVGLDLVGQEDKGRNLIDFAKKILTLPRGTKFFFHAGETNWNGVIDDNLIDALLLGTSRIGQGYALTKHPQVMRLVKKFDIAVEVMPISNQVLGLVEDARNHPAATLFADNYPVVISSDDPSFWEAKPLSHDFYYAFLGLASSRQDLRLLKQLAINSIKYSAASRKEKQANMAKWQVAWNKFVEKQLITLKI